MLAARSRSAALSGPDRLRSIRSRLILGLLLPYVCLMGVCTIALFSGPAETNRIPAILVILAAAVLLPLAMARIAHGILGQAEALETERATLAAGQSLRDARAEAQVEAVTEAPIDAVVEAAAEASEPAEATEGSVNESTEPADAVSAVDDRTLDPVDIDENAPLAAAVAVEARATGRIDPAVEELGPFAALIAADRRVDSGSTLAAQAAANTVDEPVAAAGEPMDDQPLPEAVAAKDTPAEEPGEQLAAAVAEDAPSETPETPAQEAAPRPALMPSTTARQILTDTPAEPAA